MINRKDFEKIRTDFKKIDQNREKTIQQSRQIIQLSKRIIYSVHRDDMKEASNLIKQIVRDIKKLDLKCPDTNINKVACQEYVEAILFYEFVKSGKLLTSKQVSVDAEAYLLGLCDLTGELGRKAVMDVIKKNYTSVHKIRTIMDEIYGEFLKFNLRNGELRKKSDSIKWNLKKVEDILFTLENRK